MSQAVEERSLVLHAGQGEQLLQLVDDQQQLPVAGHDRSQDPVDARLVGCETVRQVG